MNTVNNTSFFTVLTRNNTNNLKNKSNDYGKSLPFIALAVWTAIFMSSHHLLSSMPFHAVTCEISFFTVDIVWKGCK